SRRRHTRWPRDWSSDVCSSDLTVRQENGRIFLGAGVTYAAIVSGLTAFRPLVLASRSVGSPQIRNRGTVGGNLGTGSPAGDALRSEERRVGKEGRSRWVGGLAK